MMKMPRSNPRPVEHQRRRGAEQDREHDRQHGEIERVEDRLVEAPVGEQRAEIVERHEGDRARHVPVVHRHVDGEQPREHDHGSDDHRRRHGEQPVAPLDHGAL
jgi:hypothetical protein